ncbi:hypothetical protein AYO20_00759 [Fonsecaea nubica]|uniref:NACHT-NTPase and P-loop NTPases N-terminal domain-containing protein n=1 Tax=Fonsecaea nubica TaxID=856822 RepID=A0A178DDU7_9EURO|nr:hypothetical protein AYO20_00759 [Fonsecaea nubica]OAL39847.1 hypothetical protein AYO20_00759 [Fonsecaea nubica]
MRSLFILYPAASKSLHALRRNPKVSRLEVIGAISAVISIIDASIKVYDGAQKDVKLPDTFHVVGRRLSFLRNTLETCKSHLQPIQDSLSADVLPVENDGWEKRYAKVVKRLGKGNKVEELMVSIAEDVQLVVNHHAVQSAKPEQISELEKIIKEMKSARRLSLRKRFREWRSPVKVVVIAGTLTTAAALSELTYHLLRQPGELKALKDELAQAMPDPSALPDVAQLEQLPYLSAVIEEGLHLSRGISTRLQRIALDETLIYQPKVSDDKKKPAARHKPYTLRPGIPRSLTGLLIHHSSTYFEDPMAFRPQRWIDDPTLDRYLVPFSRGTRAYAELYLATAAAFQQYGSPDVHFQEDQELRELFDTSYGDLEIIGDGVIPLYRPDSHGVRIVVRAA